MFEHGLEIENIHLVGFSLGSHLAGLAGRSVQALTKGKYILPRISGLDPAGPLWYNLLEKLDQEHIRKSDAKLVDIIHTDGNWAGTKKPTGSIDFWPNGGVGPQPGCPRIETVDSNFL